METKILKIYFDNNGVFKKKLVKDFKDIFDWLNKAIPYDCDLGCYMMYCTEDKLSICKSKLLNYLKKEENLIIKKATKRLELLNKINI